MQQQLTKRKQLGNFRTLTLNRPLIDFASNDYLGLSKCIKLKQKTMDLWQKMDHLGSTGSRLITGNHAHIEHLEENIAKFHGCEAGMIFNCGYMANLGLISAVANEKDLILFDTHIHVSTHEGIKDSKARALPFRHNDLNHLENRLKKAKDHRNCFICIESIYSTDGTIAPLLDIYALSEKYRAQLIVDEAHAVGLFGSQGRGLVSEFGLEGKVFAQVITFSKALGTFGAIVLGMKSLKTMLSNFSKPFIYTTALPSPVIAAVQATYDLFPTLETERMRLKGLIDLARLSTTPIQPFYIRGNRAAVAMAKRLNQEGFDVRALLSPTVQRNKERLRLTLHSFNSPDQFLQMIQLVKFYAA